MRVSPSIARAQAAAKVLADWFEEAFSERGSADNQSLLGVAHEISDPLVEGATWIALIDFGSVDIALVIDFVRAGLAVQAPARLELHLARGLVRPEEETLMAYETLLVVTDGPVGVITLQPA